MPRDHVVAARAAYDASAEAYCEFAGTEIGPGTEGPIDRSVLAAFVELVAAGGGTRVADIGCGPGRVASFLAAHGLDVIGVDVSPAMLAAARNAHPAIRFEEGCLDDLPIDGGSLAGAVCWYSIICTPPPRLAEAFAELARVLSRGGDLLLAFQTDSGAQAHVARGANLASITYRHSLADVRRRLEHAGLEVRATTLREPELDHETTRQGFLVARRP